MGEDQTARRQAAQQDLALHALVGVDRVEHVDAEQPALEQGGRDVVAGLEPGLGHDDPGDVLAADEVLEQRGLDGHGGGAALRVAGADHVAHQLGHQLFVADHEQALAPPAHQHRRRRRTLGLRRSGVKTQYVGHSAFPAATAGL